MLGAQIPFIHVYTRIPKSAKNITLKLTNKHCRQNQYIADDIQIEHTKAKNYSFLVRAIDKAFLKATKKNPIGMSETQDIISRIRNKTCDVIKLSK